MQSQMLAAQIKQIAIRARRRVRPHGKMSLGELEMVDQAGHHRCAGWGCIACRRAPALTCGMTGHRYGIQPAADAVAVFEQADFRSGAVLPLQSPRE